MKWAALGLVATAAAVAVWADAPVQPLPMSAQADLLVVEKGQRQLIAYSHGVVLRCGPHLFDRDSRCPREADVAS